MKQKAITFILSLIAVVIPLFVIPSEDAYSNYNILKYIIVIVTGLILLILLLASYKTLHIDKKDIIILVFMCFVFISTLLSSDIKKSILGEKNRYEGLLTFAIYIIIYMCSKKYFKYEKISIFINIMYVVAMILGFFGIAQQYIEDIELYPIFNKGICATLGNSNFFGSYISIVLPIAASTFILKGNKKCFILSLVMFFNMISSGTRSTWVAFFISGILGCIYLIKEKNKKYFIRTGIILIFFIIIFVYLLTGFEFIIEKFQDEGSANNIKTNFTKIKMEQMKKEISKARENKSIEEMGSNRIYIWKMSFELMLKRPLFGCGPDNLWNELLQNNPEKAIGLGVIVDKAHNEYLHIGATLGIPALLCYLLFITVIVGKKIKFAIKDKVYFCITLGLISYLVQAFFNISTIGIAPLFWMMLGLIDNKDFMNKLKKTIDF